MKILIDINHPAHVHYFKNFIKIMGEKGHEILVVSRNKEIEHYLLKKNNIPFKNRGEGEKDLKSKLSYFFYAILYIYKQAKLFRPNVIISFGTPYPAIVGWWLGIPHISFNDTEHAKLHHILTDPFSKNIITPSSYNKDLGKKQVKFDGYMELCYLHPKYYKPNSVIRELLRVSEKDKYVILRFVSWNAAHDIGQTGLDLDSKFKLIKELSRYAKVFISSEGTLPNKLKKYQIEIPPEMIHDALAFATLFIGEGATMASECAMLGTPAIYINSLEVGYCTEEEKKYNLIFNYRNSNDVLQKAIELLSIPDLKQKYQKRRQEMLKDKIDVTAFMVWFVENYPESVKVMKENPDYQYNFK